jgi:hypothetical protein
MTEMRQISLSDIDVDYEWNSRSPANTIVDATPETDEESTGLSGLVANILKNGQKEAVDIRPTAPPFYRPTTKPWSLVAGFRRTTAIVNINGDEKLKTELAEINKPTREKYGKELVTEPLRTLIPNLQDGYILCKIHGPLSERQAFLINAHENVLREQLTPPDTTMMIKRLVEMYGLTIYELAVELGKTPGSITDYVRIAGLPAPILTHWQKGGEFDGVGNVRRVSQLEMKELAKLPAERQVDGYKRLLAIGNARAKSTAWFERAKARARHMGTMLARLQKDGFLILQSDRWEKVMGTLVGTGKRELGLSDSIKLSAIAEKFYKKELEKPVESEDEEVLPSTEEVLAGTYANDFVPDGNEANNESGEEPS